MFKPRDGTLFDTSTTNVIDMIFDSCVMATEEVDVSQAGTFMLEELTGAWNKRWIWSSDGLCVMSKDNALQNSRRTEKMYPG